MTVCRSLISVTCTDLQTVGKSLTVLLGANSIGCCFAKTACPYSNRTFSLYPYSFNIFFYYLFSKVVISKIFDNTVHKQIYSRKLSRTLRQYLMISRMIHGHVFAGSNAVLHVSLHLNTDAHNTVSRCVLNLHESGHLQPSSNISYNGFFS